MHSPTPALLLCTAAAPPWQIDALDRIRVQLRSQHDQLRRKHHAAVRAASEDELPRIVRPDDPVRVLGFIYAHIKAVDAAQRVARTLLEPMCGARHTRASWLK